VDGGRQSLVLTAYLVLAVLPALLVVQEYVERKPRAFAEHLVHHYNLSAQTATLLRGVLVQDDHHKLGSALFAIAGALVFGIGFGQVLQRVHARVWRLELSAKGGDHVRYVGVLLGLVGLILLLVLQTSEIAGHPSWADLTITPGWVLLLVGYFWWASWTLTHR